MLELQRPAGITPAQLQFNAKFTSIRQLTGDRQTAKKLKLHPGYPRHTCLFRSPAGHVRVQGAALLRRHDYHRPNAD